MNWEAVIVDDQSTDNSLEIIKEIIKNDSRFKLYQNETNQGCGFTKKKCVDLATGDYCGYLDPDDALFPDAIQCLIEEIQDYSNLVATYSQLAFCNEDLTPQRTFSKIKQVYNDKYFFNCPIQISHFFVFDRKAYLKTSGLDPNLKSAVDQDLYLKLLEVGNVKFVPEVLYKYRLHPNGISQQSSKNKAKNSFAKVIYEAMKRRGIKQTQNGIVPDQFTTAEEIYQLLEYQTKPLFRLKNKIKSSLKRY
jgi:glycosyltransferase involved in cell wall biosynthesis